MDKLTGIGGIGSLPSLQPPAQPAASQKAEDTFADLLKESVAGVNKLATEADQAVQQVHAGGAKHLHEAMIKMEEANISLRYLTQVRNKMLEAYQEIMRLQL